ncbi:hypothetical protein CK203_038600 [Vitis vinifera]|uniref:Ubiquitin-like protease family profile domain-containing protein n=2 Tax=Vitis vinifera TaxID=29760 RepID=A0A438I407_VITVI|nr:hypothetical protein CK203_038600 [Vitis vinifera]
MIVLEKWSGASLADRVGAHVKNAGPHTANMNVPSVASTSTADDDAIEVIEARVIDTSESMLRLASSLARDVAALCSHRSGSEGISSIPCPKAQHHTEYQPMRETTGQTDSHAEASLPPQVTIEEARECDRVGGSGNQAIKPSSIKRFKRTLADYALAEIGDPSEILCEMYGMYITREEISCLNAGRWVNSVIVAIVSRMMNGQQAPPARTHYFDPSFSVILTNLKTNATSQVIMDRCRMYLDAGILGHDLGTCDMMFIPVCENNHWHMHVVNFAAGRVEILSSLPLRRGNNISAATRRLSMAINKALHAYTIHMDVDVSTFEHVQPHLVQQLNGFDCGILAQKFMEFWNGATLTTSVAEDKLNMYRLQLVVELVLNERNTIRDKIMASCHL